MDPSTAPPAKTHSATLVPGHAARAALSILAGSRTKFFFFCSNGLMVSDERLSYFFERESLLAYHCPSPTHYIVSTQGPTLPPITTHLTISAYNFNGHYTLEARSPAANRGYPDLVCSHPADNLLHATPRDASPMTDTLYRAIYAIAEAHSNGAPLLEAPYTGRPTNPNNSPATVTIESGRSETGAPSVCVTALGVRGPEAPGSSGLPSATGRIDPHNLSRFLSITDTCIIGHLPQTGDHPPTWYARSDRALVVL